MWANKPGERKKKTEDKAFKTFNKSSKRNDKKLTAAHADIFISPFPAFLPFHENVRYILRFTVI